MPPSVLAMMVMWLVARSTSRERYSSRLMSQPASTYTRLTRRPAASRLLGDQRVADHRLRSGAGFLGRLGQADAALAVRVALEPAGAAAAGVDLAFDDGDGTWQLGGGGFGFLGRPSDVTVQDGHAVAAEKLLGLVLVDVHA